MDIKHTTTRSSDGSIMLTTIILITLFGLKAEAEEVSSYRCYELEGAKIVAEDGTYLGTLDNSYASDSIYNQYSDHGSTYSDESLWNEYSDHGADYSDESAFNKYASNPPVLLKDGEVIGRLTVRDYEYDAVDPRTVGEDCDWKN